MVAEQRTPAWSVGALRLVGAAVCLLTSGCIGGPHPLPPEGGQAQSTGVSQTPAVMGAAGAAAHIPETSRMPVMASTGTAGATASVPPPAAAGGAAITPPTGGSTSMSPAQSGAAGASGVAGPDGTCQPQVFLPHSADAAPDGVLFLMDRSAEMAMDYQGQPRWQLSGHALVSALTPVASRALDVGALFYPSAVAAAVSCTPAWLCPAQTPSMMPTGTSTCAVNPMASNDQIDFQPVEQALTMLTNSSALYQSIAAEGVPLRETIDQANSALATVPFGARTAVVLLVNSQPSCRWDDAQAATLLNGWRTQRRISTHVIVLPGANQGGMDKFTALAKAGGQAHVLAPHSEDALRSVLQSVVLGSVNSCQLELDPAVTTPGDAHLIVGVSGEESEMPRVAASGETLWTLSADGKQLTLLGKLCAGVTAGEYDSLHIAVGCVHNPIASP